MLASSGVHSTRKQGTAAARELWRTFLEARRRCSAAEAGVAALKVHLSASTSSLSSSASPSALGASAALDHDVCARFERDFQQQHCDEVAEVGRKQTKKAILRQQQHRVAVE